MTSILLNGSGSYAGGARNGLKFNTTVTKGKKYLMRLINTSIDTTFIFAIDNHNITVMSSDFVPIKPYTTDHVVIGIGREKLAYNEFVADLQRPTLPRCSRGDSLRC